MKNSEYQRRVQNEREQYRRAAQDNTRGTELRRSLSTVPAFEYAMQAYGPYLRAKMPNVGMTSYVLGTAATSERPPKLLSLGSSTGDWEMQLSAASSGRLHVELVDLDDNVFSAARAVAEEHDLPLQCRVADVNELEIERGTYDFILCRSSLHHFVELERVLDRIGGGLTRNGVFLVVGEWIGRCGLQLYAETERIAGTIFERLPIRYRVDSYTGKIWRHLPNVDHGRDSFEACRSEEILPALLERFQPVEYIAYDAMITPLFDFRFGPNFDPSVERDGMFIEDIVSLDIQCLESGVLKPTALFGIFRL